MKAVARRFGPLATVLVVVATLYAPTTRSFFCGYDDFHELARAAFDDSPTPADVLTRPHDDGTRYRPLNRAVTLAMWRSAGFAPFAHRARNVLAHLGVVAATYLLALRLRGSRTSAFAAALLFGVHPLANQAVSGAVWTNTLAYLCAAASLVAALGVPASGWSSRAHAAVAFMAAAIGLYEATLVTPLLVLAAARSFPARAATLRRIAAVEVAVGLAFVVVHLAVARSAHAGTLGIDAVPRLAAVALYAGAMLSPIDPVLAHVALGIPWPTDLAPGGRDVGGGAAVLLAASFIALAVAALVPARGRVVLRRAGRAIGADPALRILARWFVLALAPFLVFTAHASETYLYFPLAILVTFACTAAWRLTGSRHRIAYRAAVVVVAAWLAGATAVRNAVVLQCGAVAKRIVVALPDAVGDAREVAFADEPAREPTARYGLYGYAGVHTLGDPPLADRGLTAALQLATGDGRRHARFVDRERMTVDCGGAASIGFWVSNEGRLRRCVAGATR